MAAPRLAFMEIERRALSSVVSLRKRAETETHTVSGYAAMYNVETVIFGLWREKIAHGAFASALDGTDDVRALFNHDPNKLLGRTSSGTLTLSDDSKGLHYDIDLPDTQDARDVRELIKRGDVSGSSFGFVIEEEDWDDTPTKKGQLPLMTIRKVELFDVSPVTFPAYPQTSVSARQKGEASQEALKAFRERMDAVAVRDRQLRRLRLEIAKAWQ